jgi:hypothetical protein
MRRVVIDTNLYIHWLNAGAFSPRDRRVVRSVVAAFARAERILVPSGAVYEDAGHVLRALRESRGYKRRLPVSGGMPCSPDSCPNEGSGVRPQRNKKGCSRILEQPSASSGSNRRFLPLKRVID